MIYSYENVMSDLCAKVLEGLFPQLSYMLQVFLF